jgi:two-component system phosphate regulon sensor histidine kinase PhoR
MGFAQWFWRLFLVFAGLIAAHGLLVTVIVTFGWTGGGLALWLLWLSAALTIAAGGVAMWYSVRRIIEPLTELTRQAQAASTGTSDAALGVHGADELGVLTGAFDQMQRDLARRLELLQQNSQRLQAVLGSMAEGVLAVGPDKTILLANEAGRQLLDFATREPLGRPLVAVTRARPVHEAIAQAFQSPEPVVREFDSPGLARRTLSLRATRLPGEPCPGVMVVLHDMTELRRLENLRRELVANVSHELKTPLAAIKGYAETLRLGAVNDQEHNVLFVRRIEEQADRLHELILDILQIARIESGQEAFELANVPLTPLIEEVAAQFAEVAAAKSIVLQIEPPPAGAAAWADEEGVRTILSNLVDNAIKYTPAGGRVTIRGSAGERSVTLEVADTGIGIAEKDQARIFERFYRVDKARSHELGGTGLGLSIVKHLAQAFGGNVRLDSQPGRGATFRVELPRGEGSGFGVQGSGEREAASSIGDVTRRPRTRGG